MDKIDYSKPLFQCTLGDLHAMLSDLLMNHQLESQPEKAPKHYVYGIAGIANLFGCSEPTAQRIKNSGEIDDAISQIGGVIVVDAEYALDLLKISKKYRKSPLMKNKK
jgi:hypothetical protein